MIDGNGKPRFKIQGRYTDVVEAVDLQTKETWEVFKAPTMPPKSNLMFNFNSYALQLNCLSKKLKGILPPTDSRLREDVRQWELADSRLATSEKSRLEVNQRNRRRQLKKLLADKVKDWSDDQTFYEPKFFRKVYDDRTKQYQYLPRGDLYWQMRDNQNWEGIPSIFENDCPPFWK